MIKDTCFLSAHLPLGVSMCRRRVRPRIRFWKRGAHCLLLERPLRPHGPGPRVCVRGQSAAQVYPRLGALPFESRASQRRANNSCPLHATAGLRECRGVQAMAWHPTLFPMQLLTLGGSGSVYIWAKVSDWLCIVKEPCALEDCCGVRVALCICPRVEPICREGQSPILIHTSFPLSLPT